MANDALVGNTIEHNDQHGYFMNVYDLRPETLGFMEKRGLQGGGPTWKGLVTAALKLESAVSMKALEFDDESDVLLVTSQSEAALQVAQSLVHRLMSDPDFMARCISEAQADGLLE